MRRLILCTFLALLPACEANVGADYRGEPLVSLRGQVNKPDVIPQGDVAVVLAWENFQAEGDLVIAEKAAIDGQFPASFILDIFTPPAPELLMHFNDGEPGVTLATILALSTGADLEDLEARRLVGVDEYHVLAYVEADLPPESGAAGFLGGPLTAGFHVLDVTPADPVAYDACIAESSGDDCEHLYFDRLSPAPEGTILNLKLAPLDELYFPNFT